jgi:hypothetical protein
VVSSSTPGVLHTAIPSSAAVAGCRCCRSRPLHWRRPEAAWPHRRAAPWRRRDRERAHDRADLADRGGKLCPMKACRRLAGRPRDRPRKAGIESTAREVTGERARGRTHRVTVRAGARPNCDAHCLGRVRNVRYRPPEALGGTAAGCGAPDHHEGAGDEWVDLREVVGSTTAQIFRYAALHPQRCRCGRPAQTAVVWLPARHDRPTPVREVVRDADRPQSRHRPGLRFRPARWWSRGPRCRSWGASIRRGGRSCRRPRRRPGRFGPVLDEPDAIDRRCCSSGSSRSSPTRLLPSDCTPLPSTQRAHRAMQLLVRDPPQRLQAPT